MSDLHADPVVSPHSISLQVYDAVIAGGGPAGCAAAIALARMGRRVLLAHAGGSLARVGEGLPAQSRSLLRDCGMLDLMAEDGHRPSFGTLSAWGAEELHAQDTLFQIHGHGWQLDRFRFDQRLRMIAQSAGVEVHDLARVQLVRPADVGKVDEPLHELRLETATGESWALRARWVMDATGRSSSLAQAFGARRVRHDALVAFHLRLPAAPEEQDKEASTLVEAVESGWWYSALLPSGERMVVYQTDGDLIDRSALLSTEGFCARLDQTRHIRERARRHPGVPATPPRGADASSCQLEPAAGHHWLAVGDAAVSFDPLSSKGISNALYTGQAAARAILAAEEGDGDATARYTRHLSQIFHAYLGQLGLYYAQERRWCDSPFWQRRHRASHRPNKSLNENRGPENAALLRAWR